MHLKLVHVADKFRAYFIFHFKFFGLNVCGQRINGQQVKEIRNISNSEKKIETEPIEVQ